MGKGKISPTGNAERSPLVNNQMYVQRKFESRLSNVQAFLAKILALFNAVSKLNEISRKFVQKMVSEIENRKPPNIRKF